jgi:hypothetical protein
MEFTAWVDVAIGLTLVYLTSSLFVTIINEYFAQMFNRRAKQLIKDLNKLIDDPVVVNKLIENPALAPFFTKRDITSSYIDTKVLAQHIIGGLNVAAGAAATMQQVMAAINAMDDHKIKNHLLALSRTTSAKLEEFVQKVSIWIDSSLTMMGERYKRWTQVLSLLIGLSIAVAFNLDTIRLTNHLYRDKETREAIAVLASDFVQTNTKDDFERCKNLRTEEMAKDPGCTSISTLLENIRYRSGTIGRLPIGWPLLDPIEFIKNIFAQNITVYLGWILTALATSLGASFWFDLLNRIVNVRHGMKRPKP